MLETLLAALIISAAASTAATLLARRNRQLERERAEAVAEAREARERLFLAWKEGYTIPAPPEPEPVPEPALIPALQAHIDAWEEESAKAAQEKIIRQMLEAGKTQSEVATILGPVPTE